MTMDCTDNLKKETLEFLADNNLTIDDIKWVGCLDFKIPIENFLELADKEYDSGFGAQMVAKDLILVGKDFWIEREEYDGAEWWALKRYPKEPETIHTVHDLYGMWDCLERFID